jgi:putative Mg2+ transporter-C (MgtC) family protein
VTGPNTAATLWATGAVGALAGAWMWREAIAGATVIVAGNWFLQPGVTFARWTVADEKAADWSR